MPIGLYEFFSDNNKNVIDYTIYRNHFKKHWDVLTETMNTLTKLM